MSHHATTPFMLDGQQMWFHLHTDTSNVVLEKKARACCWTGPSDDEDEETSPRAAVPGSHMRVELRHHYQVTCDEADDVDYREVDVTAWLTFHAVGVAQLTLPGGKKIDLEARA